eukprot:COSAG01_NODE_19910_length_982_cov_2.086070_1_plen_94_part_01
MGWRCDLERAAAAKGEAWGAFETLGNSRVSSPPPPFWSCASTGGQEPAICRATARPYTCPVLPTVSVAPRNTLGARGARCTFRSGGGSQCAVCV